MQLLHKVFFSGGQVRESHGGRGQPNQGQQQNYGAPGNPLFGGDASRPQTSAGQYNQQNQGQSQNQGSVWGSQKQDGGSQHRPSTASGGSFFEGGSNNGIQGSQDFRGNNRRGQSNRGRADFQQRQNRGGHQSQSMNFGNSQDGNQQFQNSGQNYKQSWNTGSNQFQESQFTETPPNVFGSQGTETQAAAPAWGSSQNVTPTPTPGLQVETNQPDVGQGRGKGKGRGKKAKNQQGAPDRQQVGSPRDSSQGTSAVDFGTPTQASEETFKASTSQSQSIGRDDVQSTAELGQLLSGITVSRKVPKSDIDPIRRPDRGGMVGKPVKVLTNHFELKIREDIECYHYDIEITPKMSADKKREVFNQFVERVLKLGERRDGFVFDGQKNIYSCFRPNELPPKDCQMEYENLESGRKTNVTINMQFAAKVDLSQIMEYINQRHDIERPQQALNVLNTAYKHMCHGNVDFVTLKRATFSRHFGQSFDLGGGLDLWFGYQPSIIMGQWKVYLQVDLTSKGFTKEMPLLDYIAQYFGQNFNPNYQMYPNQCKELSKALSGYKIKTNHTGYVKKIFDFKESAQKMLKDSDPPQNVAQYFQSKYNYSLRFPALPLVRIHPKDKDICIPVELCTIRGQQPALKKLDEKQQGLMVRETAMDPSRRNQMIMHMLNDRTKPNNQKVFKQFRLEASPNMSLVDGRVLPGPTIYGGNNTTSNAQGGKYDDRRMKFFRPTDQMTDYVVASPQRLRDKIRPFHQAMRQQACDQGINWPVNEPRHFPFDDRNMDTVQRAFEQIQNIYNQQKNFSLVVIFLFQKNPDIYAMAKHYFDNLLKLPSQVALQKTISGRGPYDPPNPMSIKQLLLKINTKLAGINVATFHNYMGIIQSQNNYGDRLKETVSQYTDIFKKPFMVFGADVTHPEPGEHGKPSIAAVVGSLNSTLTRYGAQVMVQGSRKEMIEGMKEMFMKILKEFRRITDKIPEKILYYRDGVSEGQFSEVLIAELKAMQSACRDLNQGFTPQITFIVVNKRHKARFFQDGFDRRTRQRGIVNIDPG